MNWVIMPYIDNLDQTATALRDALDQSLQPISILAIDNGSRQSALPFPVEELDRRLMFWRYHPALLSLSTVWNTALQMVFDIGEEHALVVNNDVRLPRGLYAALLEVQQRTGAWFVSACNVAHGWYDGMLDQQHLVTPSLLESRGGPDFSCFLITRECHRWFKFDEQFIPAYHEDNDYHRRLQLAGLGHKIFSVPVPYLHYGSGTLRNVEHVNVNWNERFQKCREYYIQKWGGPPMAETYPLPFNQDPAQLMGTIDPAALLTGQGRPGAVGPWTGVREMINGQAERSHR